jgi:hypothetical protein
VAGGRRSLEGQPRRIEFPSPLNPLEGEGLAANGVHDRVGEGRRRRDGRDSLPL